MRNINLISEKGKKRKTPGSEAPTIRRMWACWSTSRGGHQDGKRAGTSMVSKQAESWGCYARRRKGAEEALHHLLVPKGGYKKAGEGL